ncbi:MAG: carboxypeptidase regulatory-like domain-containing protein [Bacteroidota bacterium]|nr:carboxypeptidase regulatory-like domain-containing protein [Bacteroidota bacterium]
MNIKITNRLLLLLLSFVSISTVFSQTNMGFLRGTVEKDKEPMSNASVELLNSNGEVVKRARTEKNGSFSIINIEPGLYTVKIVGDKIRFVTKEYDDINITTEGKTMTFEVEAEIVQVGTGDKSAQRDKQQKTKLESTSTTQTVSGDQIQKSGFRGATTMAQFQSGVTSTRGGLSGRGARTDGTAVFVDGVRVNNSSVNQSMNGQVDIMQAGIPAQYGDFTGLGISITTKGGVSAKKSASLEARTTSLFNPYHHNLIEGFYASPILWKDNPRYLTGESSIKRIPIAALNISGTINYQREPSPSYIGYYVIKDDVLAEIEKNPLRVNTDGGLVHNANYLNENDYNLQKVRPNTYAFSSAAQAKLDFRISDLATLSAFGNFVYNQSVGGGNNIMAYKQNPFSRSLYTLGYLKYTQNFKGPDSARKADYVTLNNTYFTVRFDYQSTWAKNMDNDHRENIFNYGYIGQFVHYPTEFYSYYGNLNNPNAPSRRFVNEKGDTVFLRNFWEQSGFRDTAIRFKQADINTVRGNYTNALFNRFEELGATVTNDQQILQLQGLLNGYNPNNIYSLWNSPGTQLSGYGKSQNERYTLFAMGETEVKGPQNSAKKAASGHKLQFGLTYEQIVQRSYSVGANNLWRLMYQYANSHIAELDRNNPILSYDANGVFQDTIRYNRLVNKENQSQFDRELRNRLISRGATDVYGKPITETTFLDVNSFKPSDFSLDMFSADELLNNGSAIVSYSGYDHLGNKLRGRPSVNDFLDDKAKRSIGAFMPIYTAAWFQDQFFFKDLEFRLGLRLERFDANQLVLNDPYSLYPIRQAGEVKELDGKNIVHPDNISSDYAVYVDDVNNPRKILGYRKDNNWYDENGTLLSTPDLIANRTSNGKIAPLLVDANRQEVTRESFKDYQPKVNILPRIFFKFPLNPKSLFFASYDVLAQRPNANFATIDDYVFLDQKATNSISNPALTPRITTDYQIGFKQQVSPTTLLSFISYYRETRNDISAFQFNNAYPITYISFNNLDFSTVKGLILEADYKAQNNISLSGNYTLQFADGTGSNINSQRALIASNQPNLRSLFPMGELDIRHQFKGVINWAFFDGKGITPKEKAKRKYTGPVIGNVKVLSNTNINLSFTAVSGLPYTATLQPVQLGSANRSPIKGTPFGSRLPWQFNSNLNIQKDIPLDWKTKDGKSRGAYLQVYYFVTNLLNTRNVFSVNPYSGSAEDDGFLNSPQGRQALQNQLDAAAYTFYYRAAVNSPFNFQAPRMMYLGARVFF